MQTDKSAQQNYKYMFMAFRFVRIELHGQQNYGNGEYLPYENVQTRLFAAAVFIHFECASERDRERIYSLDR